MRKKIELIKNCENKIFDEGYDEFITFYKARSLRPATIKHYDGIILGYVLFLLSTLSFYSCLSSFSYFVYIFIHRFKSL
jgi:hypothetical protein